MFFKENLFINGTFLFFENGKIYEKHAGTTEWIRHTLCVFHKEGYIHDGKAVYYDLQQNKESICKASSSYAAECHNNTVNAQKNQIKTSNANTGKQCKHRMKYHQNA